MTPRTDWRQQQQPQQQRGRVRGREQGQDAAPRHQHHQQQQVEEDVRIVVKAVEGRDLDAAMGALRRLDRAGKRKGALKPERLAAVVELCDSVKSKAAGPGHAARATGALMEVGWEYQ